MPVIIIILGRNFFTSEGNRGGGLGSGPIMNYTNTMVLEWNIRTSGHNPVSQI